MFFCLNKTAQAARGCINSMSNTSVKDAHGDGVQGSDTTMLKFAQMPVQRY